MSISLNRKKTTNKLGDVILTQSMTNIL